MEISESLVRDRLAKLDEAKSIYNTGEYYKRYSIGNDGNAENSYTVNGSCFGTAISFFSGSPQKSEVVTDIFVNLGEPKFGRVHDLFNLNKDCALDNFILFEREQMLEHMDYLRKEDGLGLKFDVDLGDDRVIIKVNKEDIVSCGQFRFILFWLRQAYRYPYNLFLIDAMELQRRHPDIELWNLLTIPHFIFASLMYSQNFPEYSGFNDVQKVKKELGEKSFVYDVLSATQREYSQKLYEWQQIKFRDSKYHVRNIRSYMKSAAIEFYDDQTRFDAYEMVLEKKLELWDRYYGKSK